MATRTAFRSGSDARSKKLQAAFKCAVSSMKVTYLHCSPDQHAEQRKWRLTQKDQTVAENATLQGWKRLVGVASVAQMLKAWHLDATPDGISKWFAAEKVVFSPKVVRQILMVHERVSALHVESLLDDLESACGIDHALSKLTVLDGLCQMTRVDSNPGLTNSLLKWVMCDLKEALMSRLLRSDANRETVLLNAKAGLLGRRIVVYLSAKLRLPKLPEPVPGIAADHPSVTYLSLFASHEKFHSSGLATSDGDLTWCSKLYAFQREAVTLLKQFLMPVALVRDALLTSVAEDGLMSAEVAMQQPAWIEIVNLPKLLEDRKAELTAAGLLQAEDAVPLPGQVLAAAEPVDPPVAPAPAIAIADATRLQLHCLTTI